MPDEAAAEVRRVGQNDRMVGIAMGNNTQAKPFGHPAYHPIYKAACSGLLKVFLDLLPSDILRGKSVLPLATGGSPGHLLAIDYALKPVLGALGARHIVDAVYVLDEQLVPHETLGYVPDEAIVERLDRALQGLADVPPRRASPIAPPLRESPTLVARFHS